MARSMVADPADPATLSLTWYARINVGVSILVLALKVLSYEVTASVALLSDALESTINVAMALMALGALAISARPPDANHPFGHHKAEYFSAVLEGVLIVLAAGFIFYQAYLHLAQPASLDAPGLGIAISAVASAINGVWGLRLVKIGTAARSPALVADGRHVLSDVVSSGGVVAGVVAAVLTGWLWLDAAVAACAGLYILFTGYRLVRESVGGLMDHAANPETLALIQECIAFEGRGAIEAHDIQTRPAGPVTFIQFHLVVPATMTVSDAHDICDRIEISLAKSLPGARVVIHVEPENKVKHAGIRIA